MGGFSRKTAVGVLKHIFGKEESAKPAKVYLSLLTVVPTSASTGASVTEAVSATGYVKKEIPVAGLTAEELETSLIKLTEELVFAAITAGEATVVAWCITDKAGAKEGNLIAWGTCTSTVISTTQTPPKVEANKLEVTLK